MRPVAFLGSRRLSSFAIWVLVDLSMGSLSVSLKLSDSRFFAGEVSVLFPSLSALCVVPHVLGIVGMFMQTKSRYTCEASLIVVGVVCCVVAIAALMIDMPVKKQSGAESAYVPPPKHSAGNLIVPTKSSFTERDLKDTYVDASPFAKPGNHTHRQRPGSKFTVSGFVDIAGTSSQEKVPH